MINTLYSKILEWIKQHSTYTAYLKSKQKIDLKVFRVRSWREQQEQEQLLENHIEWKPNTKIRPRVLIKPKTLSGARYSIL